MNSLDEVLPEISRINDSIQDILQDIKLNTNKKNKQTIEDNKVKLKQIATKLKQLQKNMLTFYHPVKTEQTSLSTFEKNKQKINKHLIERNY